MFGKNAEDKAAEKRAKRRWRTRRLRRSSDWILTATLKMI